MADIYKIKMKFADDAEAKYTVTGAVVAFNKQPDNLSLPESELW
jgi:hypothetical protein